MKRDTNILRLSMRAVCIIICFYCFLLTACSPEIELLENTLLLNQAELISKDQPIKVLFDAKGGTATVELKANRAWEASFINGRASWCTLSSDAGKRGTVTLTVSVAENDTYEERSATICFTCKNVKQTIIVVQKQNDALLVSSSKLEVPDSGGIYEIMVRHNIEYDVIIDEESKSWISILKTKSLVSSTVSLEVAVNQELSKRIGHVLLRSSIGEERITVYQDGEKPVIVLTENQYTVSDEGGTIVIEIKSNLDFEYSITEGTEWISEVGTKSLSTHKLSFSVEANETYDERTGRILFSNRENGLTEEVVVKQKQKVLCVKYTTKQRRIMVPTLFGLNTDGLIFWGDGSYDVLSPDIVHDYSSEGEHTIVVESRGIRGIQLPIEHQMKVNFTELSK